MATYFSSFLSPLVSQRTTTAVPTSTGMTSTQSMKTASSKTVTGSSRNSQSWPLSVALTTNPILKRQRTLSRTAPIENKDMTPPCIIPMRSSPALLPHIVFSRSDVLWDVRVVFFAPLVKLSQNHNPFQKAGLVNAGTRKTLQVFLFQALNVCPFLQTENNRSAVASGTPFFQS